MCEYQIISVLPDKKGRKSIRFENGVAISIYKSELKKLSEQEIALLFQEGGYISENLYRKLLCEIVGLRAKKRALLLLEQRDYTVKGLEEKLRTNGYPEECVAEAICYVRQYRYVDDFRYAKHYISYYQEKRSRQRLKADLLKKGVDKKTAELALEEIFVSDEKAQIATLLKKKHYDYANSSEKEKHRIYQFLLRKGYRSSDVMEMLSTCDEKLVLDISIEME